MNIEINGKYLTARIQILTLSNQYQRTLRANEIPRIENPSGVALKRLFRAQNPDARNPIRVVHQGAVAQVVIITQCLVEVAPPEGIFSMLVFDVILTP